MSMSYPLPARQPPGPEETAVRLVLLGAVLLLFGPLFVAGSVWLYARSRRVRGWLWWVVAGLSLLASVGLLSAFDAAFGEAFRAGDGLGWAGIGRAWLLSVVLIPGGAAGLVFFEGLDKLLRPRSLTEQIAERQRWQQEADRGLSEEAGRWEEREPRPAPGLLRLGPRIGGDDFGRGSGVRVAGGWVAIEERLLNQHLFVAGTTGKGKSETLKRLMAEVLQNTDRDLYLVDGGGDPKLAQAVRDLAWHHRGIEAPVFRLGTGTAGARYDGFRGDAEAIYNRLAAMIGVRDAEGGDAEYYARMNRTLLYYVCHAPGGPPRSFEDLDGRLDLVWLRRAWGSDPGALRRLGRFKEKNVQSLDDWLAPLITTLGDVIGPDGFALEDSRAAVFSLSTMGAGDTTAAFVRWFVEDVKQWAGRRQKRPAVLIIDEFGAAFGGARNVIDLIAQARKNELSIVLASQSVADIPDEGERERILESTNTTLLMGTRHPERLAALAGTKLQLESSMQFEEGEATEKGTTRPQHAYRVSPNDVGRLGAGELYLIRDRRAVKLKVSRVGAVAEAPPEVVAGRPPRRAVPPEPKVKPDKKGMSPESPTVKEPARLPAEPPRDEAPDEPRIVPL